MQNNFYSQNRADHSLSELILLRKKISARLEAKNHHLNPIDMEISSLIQQNNSLKKHIHENNLLLAHLIRQRK